MASGKAPTSSRTSCLKAPDHVPVCFLFNKAGWRQLLCVGSVRSWSSKMRARTQFESGGTRQSSEPGCSCVRWGSQGELPGREHSPALQEGRKLPREAPGVPRSHGRSQASEGRAGPESRMEAGPLLPLAPGLSLHPFLSLHADPTASSAWLSPSVSSRLSLARGEVT